ncbi:hypothetical protein [Moraxella lacunata]|uniref:hypothetical protein n=1 Tax=Moraxella lacunata TaxID=477 RepID=UPI003EE3B8D1
MISWLFICFKPLSFKAFCIINLSLRFKPLRTEFPATPKYSASCSPMSTPVSAPITTAKISSLQNFSLHSCTE